ncbi:putative Leucine-rich repeat family protein [Hibiscus syriacus]|uniref:Leucine-rich repeat family protein n=1 Tax=Hibiscus syriacus TaxID=106335 RepID=A0A6A3AI05_HIBSY|nr:putative Leucine-rich repeat family protein [Hibiscus syriacus]
MSDFSLRCLLMRLENLWDKWNIRGAMLFSLLLQFVLVFVAPLRKSTRKKARHLPPLDCISLSDAAAKSSIAWLRHFFSLVTQAGAVAYVFFLSLPHNNLMIPTALMFCAGFIKYGDRTLSLYLASLDKIRDSMTREADPGPDYSKLTMEYEFKRGAGLPTRIVLAPEPEASDIPHKEGNLNHLEVVSYAYHYFQTFKGIIADLMFSYPFDESRDFFNRRTAEDALRVIEVELNFIYETLFTKIECVYSWPGFISRCLAFGSTLATLGIFHFKTEKHEYNRSEVGITYTLLLGAISLDVIAFLSIVTDRTFTFININPDRPTHGIMGVVASVFSNILALKKSRWHLCKCTEVPKDRHHVLANPTAFRRWSGSISSHNLIRYCLKSDKKSIHEFPSLRLIVFGKIFHFLGFDPEKVCLGFDRVKRRVTDCFIMIITCPCTFFWRITNSFPRPIKKTLCSPFTEIYSWIEDTLDEFFYVSIEPFIKELWEFIFDELKKKAEFADTPETAKRISSARGEWALTDIDSEHDRSKILRYVSDVPYDESILLWHIATDLCYQTEKEETESENGGKNLKYMHFSKILSDYMLYLLVFQPTMMSPVADKKACGEILLVNTDVEPEHVKGNRSKSVLFSASILAKELKRMDDEDKENKWMVMSRVWVELVSYAARHCRGITYAAEVSKGGQLISFFWLLMAHFGLGVGVQIKEKHARAKLIVEK